MSIGSVSETIRAANGPARLFCNNTVLLGTQISLVQPNLAGHQ